MKKNRDYADILSQLVDAGISETEAYNYITYLMGYDKGYSKGVKNGAIIVLVLAVAVFKVLQFGGLL